MTEQKPFGMRPMQGSCVAGRSSGALPPAAMKSAPLLLRGRGGGGGQGCKRKVNNPLAPSLSRRGITERTFIFAGETAR
jgi:hypothetical protein